ncbi:uncharacterized protein LOC142972562 [Anticarsia gemmatalis]|uniref:uncharacterized protein LOC142972562 n=1 Tax=Anticarsia gemmatalis TaxID=129554 RepID=UPI003F76F1CA
MGDTRIITASERNVLHKTDSGGMRFQLKVPLPGLGPALTFTAKHNPFLELYKIIIGRQTKVVNMTAQDQDVTTFTPNNTDFHHFQEFWITWYNKKLRMGVGEEEQPFLEYVMHTDFDVGYVQFNTMSRNWAPVEWIIETSPVMLKKIPPIRLEERLEWVTMEDNKLPADAMIGGFEDEPIYIARAFHNNSLCPGKYVPSKGMAFLAWGHREHVKKDFEILCGYNAKWIKTKLNYIPTNAFVGGRSEVQNEPLYIGRAMHEGNLLPGKIHIRYKTLFLPYKGKEVEKSNFEILVIPQDGIPQAIPFDMMQEV